MRGLKTYQFNFSNMTLGNRLPGPLENIVFILRMFMITTVIFEI